MRTLVTLFFVGLGISAASPAEALPAPWSEDELIDASDAVVDAEVVEVICLGEPVVDSQKTTTYYRSTLVAGNIQHGDLPSPFQIDFLIEDWSGMQPVGGWSEPQHPVGQKATLYLEKKGDPDLYGIVWWNGMTTLPDSAPQPLPDCWKPAADPSPEPVWTDVVPAPDIVEEVVPAADIIKDWIPVPDTVEDWIPAPDLKEDAASEDSPPGPEDAGPPPPDTAADLPASLDIPPELPPGADDTAATPSEDLAGTGPLMDGKSSDGRGGCAATGNGSPASALLLMLLALGVGRIRRRHWTARHPA